MKRLLLPWIFIVVLFSCSDGSDEGIKPASSEIDFSYRDMIDKIEFLFDWPAGIDKAKASLQWSITEENIELLNAIYEDAYFYLPEINEPKNVKVTLTLNDGKNTSSVTKEIPIPALTEVRKKGIGRTLEEEKNNNVDYDWYFDQGVSGEFSLVNCGPSSAAMVVKWVNKDYDETPEDARNFLRPAGEGMPLHELTRYLSKYNVAHDMLDNVSNISILKEIVDAGGIAIIGLDMYDITYQANSEWHTGKFYPTLTKDWTHFVVIKGYKLVDGIMYYEVYDPYSLQKRYANGQLKGLDRYYRADELDKGFKKLLPNRVIAVSGKDNL